MTLTLSPRTVPSGRLSRIIARMKDADAAALRVYRHAPPAAWGYREADPAEDFAGADVWYRSGEGAGHRLFIRTPVAPDAP